MENLPYLTEKEKNSISAEILKKINSLKDLALKGFDLNHKITATIKIGNTSICGEHVEFPIIVELKRGNRTADGHPVESIMLNNDELLEENVETNSKGTFSVYGSVKNINTNVRLKVAYRDSKGNLRRTEACISIEKILEPKANKLAVTVPGSSNSKINKLDKDQFFTVHLLTALNGKGLGSKVRINSSDSWEFISSNDESDTTVSNIDLQIPQEGSTLLRIKPSDDTYQEFIFSLLGTDQTVKVTYRKPEADKLSITVPGFNQDNAVCEATAPDDGFTVNLQTLLGDKGIDDIVIATSSHGFKLKSGSEPISDESAEHHVAVTSIKTITVYPSKDWQKINFGTERTVPQTIEFRKRS